MLAPVTPDIPGHTPQAHTPQALTHCPHTLLPHPAYHDCQAPLPTTITKNQLPSRLPAKNTTSKHQLHYNYQEPNYYQQDVLPI